MGFLSSIGVIITLGITLFAVYFYQDITKTGYTALGFNSKILCTERYVAQRMSLDDVYTTELAMPVFSQFLRHFTIVDDSTSSVTTTLHTATRTAVLRPGYGCVLLPIGSTTDTVLINDNNSNKQPTTKKPQFHSTTSKQFQDMILRLQFALFPYDDMTVDYEQEDTWTRNIEKHVDIQTHAFVILHKGQIVYEQYGHNDFYDWTAETLHYGWSMAKTVTQALIGLRIAQGHMSLTQPLCPTCGDATLEDGLRMQSGLAFDEVYHPFLTKDPSEMLFYNESTVAFAAHKGQDVPAGKQWSYASGTTNLLSRAVRNSFDTYEEFLAFPQKYLFGPANITSAVLEYDAAGDFVGSSFALMTARDWALFGRLYVPGISSVLSDEWISFTGQTTQVSNGQYGAHVWTNSPSKYTWEPFPPNSFAALGYRGQMVWIHGAKDLVVVRLGSTNDPNHMDVGSVANIVMNSNVF